MNIETNGDSELSPFITAGLVIRLPLRRMLDLEDFVNKLEGAKVVYQKYSLGRLVVVEG